MNIGGKNLTNVQYANIGSQVKFIDTIRYYNQSLSFLAKSVDENEKTNLESLANKLLKQTQHIPLFLIPFQIKTRSGFLTTCQAEKELFPTKKKKKNLTKTSTVYLKTNFLARLNSIAHSKMK